MKKISYLGILSVLIAMPAFASYSDEKYDYTFEGWNTQEGATVVGEINEVAEYEKTLRKFTVTFNYRNLFYSHTCLVST